METNSNNSRTWTPEEDIILVNLYKKYFYSPSMFVETAQAELSRTSYSINGRMHVIRKNLNSSNAKDRKKVEHVIENGFIKINFDSVSKAVSSWDVEDIISLEEMIRPKVKGALDELKGRLDELDERVSKLSF